MSKPKIESRFSHFERDGDNCRHGDPDPLRTHPLSTPVSPDCPPADDSNRASSISKNIPSGEDPYLECANLLLPIDESFPISFLQRRYRIGYSRATKLHEALRKRRAEWSPNRRSGNG